MKTAEKITLRVLMVALLAVVGLAVLPGVSLAQSALQVVAIEGSGIYDTTWVADSEPRITNPTTMPLCANVYLFNSDGSPYDCYSVPVPPFGSLDDFSSMCDTIEEDCIFNFEGSFFIVSGVPQANVTVNGGCNPFHVHPKAGLRSWLMIDEQGALGINAQDAVLGSDVLSGLMRACFRL
jgi:hypothetical protein